MPREVVERLTTVRLLSQTGRNTSHLDLAACAERGITVSAGGAGGPQATAELTWALILAAQRHLPDEVQRLRDGQWQSTVGTGLHAKTLGIHGLGRIGSLVAEVGRAFGMRVVVWGREGSLTRATEAGYAAAPSREGFFAECDVLCVHLPLNAETTRDRDGRRPGPDEAGRTVRQHLASRDRRARCARRSARSGSTRGGRRSTCSRPSRCWEPPTRCSGCRT